MVWTIRADEKTALSASGTTTLKIDIAGGTHFTVKEIGVKYTGNFKITRIYNTGAKKDYLVGNLHETHFAEESGKFMTLPDPIQLDGPTSLKFDITDTSASENNVYIACIGDESS